jgi:hypothetical protein
LIRIFKYNDFEFVKNMGFIRQLWQEIYKQSGFYRKQLS